MDNARVKKTFFKIIASLIFVFALFFTISSTFATDYDFSDSNDYDAKYFTSGGTLTYQGTLLVGDVNGDSQKDLIFADGLADNNGTNTGSVWIIFGGSDLSGDNDLSTSSNYNVRIDGHDGAQLGRYNQVSVGDVNGDGNQDLILGGGGSNTRSNSGSLYVIYSTKIDDVGSSTGNVWDLETTSNFNIRYDGGFVDGYLSNSGLMGVADLNADGSDDLVVGANRADSNGTGSGSVYIIYSTLIDDYTTTGNVVDLATSSNYNIRFDGASAGDNLGNNEVGAKLGLGDVNGDGNDDLVLGAKNTDYNSTTNGGSAYVFFSTLTDDYSSTGNNLVLSTSGNYNIRYDGSNDYRLTDGGAIEIGDVNGDSKGDLVLGSERGFASDGVAYVMFSTLIDDVGTSTGNDKYITNSDSHHNIRFRGDINDSDPLLTRDGTILVDDVNGDGSKDLILGAPGADVSATDTGALYVVYSTLIDDVGSTTGNYQPLSTSSHYNIRYEGPGQDPIGNDNALSVGDINGDGNQDLIFGASTDDINGTSSGSVWYIDSTLLDDNTGTGNNHDIETTGVYTDKYVGPSSSFMSVDGTLAAGDINGDGSDDIAMGARGVSSLFVVHGIPANTAPNTPSSLGPSGLVDGSYTGDNTPTLTFDLTDPDDSDQVQYRIQIDNDSDFSSPVVDYTSATAAEGSRSFTVGQAAGSGSYTTGSSGQTLSGGSYYWQVKAIDDDSAESSYTQANSGSVAFIVDATAPTVPSDVAPSTTPTSDSTPTWTWTASTDSGIGLSSTPYTVQWCTDSGFSGCSSNTATSSTTSFTHSTALADDTWYLRVKAADDAGNESAYSSNGTVVIDTSSPSNFEIKDPDSKSYTNDERPEFVWTVDSTASTYDISVDNGDDGDFEITGISATGSGTTEANRYEVKYGDSKITFQTKSSSSWGDSDNDGELNEGEREVTITATDSSSNESIKTQKFYVDRSGPSIEIETIGEDAFENEIALENNKPTIKIKATDELNGETNGVASGPEKGEINVKRKGILGIYSKIKSESFDFNNLKWDDSGLDVSDNKKNDADKYSTYEFNFDENLNQGDYKVEINAEDKVGNSSDQEFSFTITQSTDLTVTTTPVPSEQDQQEQPGSSVVDEVGQEEQERFYELDIKLFDKSGNPVSNANVNLAGTTYTTNQNGQVLVENVKEGSHVVRVNYNDFTGREEVVLSGDVKRQSVEIQMQIDSQVKNPVFRVISNVWNSVFNTLFGWISSIF